MKKIIAVVVCLASSIPIYSQSNITAAEYFIDTDPGFGKGISIPLPTPSTNLNNIAFSASLTGLTQGVHNLYIRTKAANGKWSVTNRHVFYKPTSSGVTSASNIVKAEYFIDTDPGFGNAINIPLTPGLDLQNINFIANITSLPAGVHNLFIRSRNADGKWSITNRHVFYKPASDGPTPSNIVKAEYFFDTDPGFGNAINIPLTPGTDVQNINFTAAISSLSVGVHHLFIRSKNAAGKWSITNRFVFFRANPARSLPPADITLVEYFIDTDPGFGNAVPVAVNPAPQIADFLMPVNISGLSAGNHKLFIRSKASSGWSITNEYEFSVSATAAAPSINVNAITKTVMCARDSVRLSFDARGTYNAGNVFNVELSDASGSFAAPQIIASHTGIKSAIVNIKLPSNLPGGTNYRMRVSSTNPGVTGITGSDVLTIGNWPYIGPDTTLYHNCLNETSNLNPLYNTTGLTAVWNTANTVAAPPGTYRLIVTNNFGCTDTSFAFIKLEVATWVGSVSSDWHTAANWDIGKVPAAYTHVIIPGPTPNPSTISNSNASAASIQARNGSNVQVTNARTLDVTGKCINLPPN